MIQLTDQAVSEIKRLQTSDQKAIGKHLRVKVIGGGCSGMSYQLDFENDGPTDFDQIFEKEGVKLIVDKKSYVYLMGTELDYSGGLNGKGFVFNNPNAKRTCGCGSSFST